MNRPRYTEERTSLLDPGHNRRAVKMAAACKGTFPSFLPILRLDRVWYDVPRGMKVFAHRLAGPAIRTLSDHLPLVVEVDCENQ